MPVAHLAYGKSPVGHMWPRCHRSHLLAWAWIMASILFARSGPNAGSLMTVSFWARCGGHVTEFWLPCSHLINTVSQDQIWAKLKCTFTPYRSPCGTLHAAWDGFGWDSSELSVLHNNWLCFGPVMSFSSPVALKYLDGTALLAMFSFLLYDFTEWNKHCSRP